MAKINLFKKFTAWEYWPSFMFYVPNLPYALYLVTKARNFTVYSAVNPAIKSSGNGTESKFETLKLIPDEYKPSSIFVSSKRSFETVVQELHKQGIDYPIIAKPDIGFRGMLVEKIHSDHELKVYLEAYPLNIILQEFIDLPNECGIFYHCMPNAEKGTISSLTLKSFLSVQGNGISTLAELVAFDKRAQHYTKMLEVKHKDRWYSIPEKGRIVLLSDIGNHIKGTQFINGNHLITPRMEEMMDAVNEKIEGWYYGRLDVKYTSMEALEKGEGFIILEINGIISEPTHMYDSYNTTYFQALKSIRDHWNYVYNIGLINIKNGVKTKDFFEFWKEIKWLIKYSKKVKKLSETSR